MSKGPAGERVLAQVEQLLWRLLRHYKGRQAQRPAVILLNSAYSTQNFAMPVSSMGGRARLLW